MQSRQSSSQKNGNKSSCDQLKLAHQQSNFILKAYQLVNNPKNSEIIHWSRSGYTFIIQDIERFEKELLPLYFRHNRYQSFVRQLNMYDFHKIRNGDYYCDNKSQFRHEEFSKGNIQSILQIKRKGFQARNKQKENTKNKKIHKTSTRKIINKKKSTPVKLRSQKKIEKSIFEQQQNSFFVQLSIQPENIQAIYQNQNKQDKMQKMIEEMIDYNINKPQPQTTGKKNSKINECIQLAEQVKDKWIQTFEKITGKDDIKAMKQLYYQVKDRIIQRTSEQKKTLLQNASNFCEKQSTIDHKKMGQSQRTMEMELLEQEDAIVESIFRAQIRSTLICITSQTYLNNQRLIRGYDTLMGI